MYIACDIGGSNFRVAKSIDFLKFDEPIIKETPNNPKDGLKLIVETIKSLTKNESISGAIFGVAGVLNQEHTTLLRSPHLPDWERLDLKSFFEQELPETKIYIENDSDIVGLGEAIDGAGKGFEIVVYITISTGIGGVKIVNGIFERNRFGFEPGFQILNVHTEENFEDLCSGTAVEKKFRMHPKEVAQTPEWDRIENDIAVGLHNSIIHWSPDVLVIGGSMAKDLNAQRITEKIARLMKIHPELPVIKIAELDSIGGIHGGFAFLRQKFNI